MPNLTPLVGLTLLIQRADYVSLSRDAPTVKKTHLKCSNAGFQRLPGVHGGFDGICNNMKKRHRPSVANQVIRNKKSKKTKTHEYALRIILEDTSNDKIY